MAAMESIIKREILVFTLLCFVGLFGAAIDIDLYGHLFVDLIADYTRDRNIEIFGSYFEFGLSKEVAVLYLDGGGDLDGFSRVVKRKASLDGYLIDAIFVQGDVAGIGSGETGFRIFIAFYIILVEMFLHQLFGEDKPFEQQLEGEVLFAGIDDGIHLVVFRFDVFQGCFGIKADEAVAGGIKLAIACRGAAKGGA